MERKARVWGGEEGRSGVDKGRGEGKKEGTARRARMVGTWHRSRGWPAAGRRVRAAPSETEERERERLTCGPGLGFSFSFLSFFSWVVTISPP